MADLPVFQLVASKGQDTIGDCGICALGTICGRSYEDVVAIAVQQVGERWKEGLFLTQVISIAAQLGVTLKRRIKYDLETDNGILNCWIIEHPPGRRPRTECHLVVLMDGRIYDSDLRVWAVDAFQRHYEAKFGTLLELV